MQLTVRDVASLLDVPEKKIHDWIQKKNFPHYYVNDQYRFNRAEVLEWVARRNLTSQTTVLSRAALVFRGDESKDGLPSLSQALEAGGVVPALGGNDKESILRNLVALVPVAKPSQDLLYDILLARENLSSTAVGEGIAIPHARSPVILDSAKPAITLCFLEKPLDFGAPDGKPVSTLFFIVSPTVRVHLHLLSRLSSGLHDPGFRAAVARRAGRDEVLAEAKRVDAQLPTKAAAARTDRS